MRRLDTEGLAPLQEQLRQLDPIYAQTADLQNSQRVIRALEVSISAGQPYSSFRKQETVSRPFQPVFMALDRPREELYERIDRRMDAMLADGLVEEVRSLAAYRDLTPLQTVGYKEVFDYLDGAYDYEEMVRLLKRNSRRYAKRQLTWFRHQGDYHWFRAGDYEGVKEFCQTHQV